LLRIDRITLREIRLRLREPFRISSGTVHDRRILLLELEDADGASAWSECVAGEEPNYSPETIDTAWHAIRTWLAPRLLGREVAGPHEVHPLLERGVRGHEMARAAVEMGCWALAAERRGEPLAVLLGGTRDRVATGVSLGLQPDPSALVERAERARRAGYRRIKIKIAPGADLEFLAAVRAALGPEAPLMADANSCYTLADAEHLSRLDALDLLMIEQPLATDDLVRHAALQRRLRTPICLDESITSVQRAEDMITLGSGRIVNIKPGRVGGFLAARAIHDVCAAQGIPVWCGGMLESGVGRAHNVALASLPNFSMPGDLSPSARYWERDVVSPEWTMDADGWVKVPLDGPGAGVAVDRHRVDDATVRSEVLTANGRPLVPQEPWS
jgi:o-succinylbenzoate synthase